MVRDAVGQREASTGRLLGEANRIDIEIISLKRASVGIDSMVTLNYPIGAQQELFSDLPESATDRVIEDIEKESNEIPRDKQVREYLASLPPGITRHEYELVVDGEMKRHCVLGAPSLVELIQDLPFLVQQTGRVIGVGFDPGSKWVRIKAQDGSEVTIQAQDRTVDRALEIRDEDVKVLYLDSGDGSRRLLRIQSSGELRVRLDKNKFVFDKWRNVLEVLAK